MAGTMPRTTQRDPWDILSQMTEMLNQRGNLAERQAYGMENADFAAQQQIARMRLANELQDTSWGKRHDIGRSEQLQDRTYNEGRESTIHNRNRGEFIEDRSYRTKEQIDAEQRRRDEWDRTHGIIRGEQKADRLEQKSDAQEAEDRRRFEWDRQHDRARGEAIADRDIARQEKRTDRIESDESWDRRQEKLKELYPDRYSRTPVRPGSSSTSRLNQPDPAADTNKGEVSWILPDSYDPKYDKLPDGYESTGRVSTFGGKRRIIIAPKAGATPPPIKDESSKPGTMPDPAAGSPTPTSKGSKGDRQGAIEGGEVYAGSYGDDQLAGGDETDPYGDSEQDSYIRSGTRWLASAEGKPYADLISRASDRYGIEPDMLASLLMQESRFNPNARSPAGAIGVAQFMPGTARDYGIDPRDPSQAIPAAAKYLARSMQKYDGNIGLALASYNAGTGNVDKGIFPKETRDYVQKITGKPLNYWLRGGGQDDAGGITEVAKATSTRIPKTIPVASKRPEDDDDPLFWVDV